MSNTKDFKVKNGIQPTSYFEGVGTVVSESVGYALSQVNYDSVSFSVVTQDITPTEITFNNNGTKMYILGSNQSDLIQYSLSTAWDVSTASYDSVRFSFNVSGQDTDPVGIAFSTDGTSFFMLGATNDRVHQYSLTTAFDVDTMSFDSVTFSIASQTTAPKSLAFNSDGTKMYVSGSSNIFQYSLSTAYDISTASYDSVSFSTSRDDVIVFSTDGTKLYGVNTLTDAVFQHTLTTAFDVSTASYDGVSFEIDGINLRGITFSSDGTKMYLVSGSNVLQYSTVLTTAELDLSTGSVFEITPTSDIQVTLSNPADSGTVSGATLLLSAVGTEYTITYDTAIEWPSGTAPTSPAIGETDIITFNTRDGGTSYQAVQAIDGAS